MLDRCYTVYLLVLFSDPIIGGSTGIRREKKICTKVLVRIKILKDETEKLSKFRAIERKFL